MILLYKKTEQHKPQEENMDKRGCSGMMSSSCTISGTHRVILVKNPGISHERGNLVLTVRTRLSMQTLSECCYM